MRGPYGAIYASFVLVFLFFTIDIEDIKKFGLKKGMYKLPSEHFCGKRFVNCVRAAVNNVERKSQLVGSTDQSGNKLASILGMIRKAFL
ncbi:hypothetical protein SAMN04488057_11047 [Cyclobacterium lianum]|uniref:Uncharacterized protein n=1 Tax=Cyclobacterium lianum TaxID=388280 RepID=A0A1M7PRG6_9BACT|nr:hypothetical protein SAMN04488057_11047 [Cyclobacterium lianum]